MMATKVGKYYIWTVGCQMNMADSQEVQQALEGIGWAEAASIDEANLVILNTCSVRQAPEDKAHGKLMGLKRAKASRDDLLVAMMGCMVGNQKQNETLRQRYPHVDLFFKVEQAGILPGFLNEHWRSPSGEGCLPELEMPEEIPVLPAEPKRLPLLSVNGTPSSLANLPLASRMAKARSVTAWLPVIHGCNKVCTYCIVPYRRGRERSVPTAELIERAQKLVQEGAVELTLLGQTVEAYGHDLPDQQHDLADLMVDLQHIEQLKRIRFTTSYPKHMTDEMIVKLAGLSKVCEHINLPVQSGDEEVLRRMKRGYTLESYVELLERIRRIWPGVAFSTDIIVGFCDETEQQFQHTLDLIKQIRFDVVHVAAYSPRPGTLAGRWEDSVPLEEKKRRLHEVDRLQESIAVEINRQLIGKEVEILVEEVSTQGERRQWRGRTRTNKLVFCPVSGESVLSTDTQEPPSPRLSVAALQTVKLGTLITVQVEKTTAWSLQGCLVGVEMYNSNKHATTR